MKFIDLRSPFRFAAALFVVLVVPVLFFQKWRPGFQSPGARSGDEPHYLVIVHSIVNDFDLDIANNYSPIRFAAGHGNTANVQREKHGDAYPQGVYLSGFPLSRHTNLVPEQPSRERIYRWDEVYHFVFTGNTGGDGPQTATGAEIAPEAVAANFEARPRPGFEDFDPTGRTEVVWHPLGYPVLLALFTFPLVLLDSYWCELVIVLLQFALYVFALNRVRLLVPIGARASDGRSSNPRGELLLVAATAMALSAFYFAASIYTEGVAPALLLLAVVAFTMKRPLEVSAYLGLLFFIKESYAPLGPIFAAVYWWQSRNIRDVAIIAIFPIVAFALFLARNLYFYGAPLQVYYPWAWNHDPLAGLAGLFFAAKKGVFVFTPVFVFFLAGLPALYRRQPQLALVCGASFVYFLTLTAATAYWSGGPTYGYRLLTPAVAMLTPAFFAWLHELREQSAHANDPGKNGRSYVRAVLRALTFGLLGVSTLNGFFGATNLNYAYDTETYVNLIQPEQSQLYRRLHADESPARPD